MHCGYVTTLNNVRKHPNADKLVLATCFVNTVCVNKDMYHEGEIGVYFPVDLQLSMEFCQKNGLLAVYENGVNVSGGYMDPAKRNVKAIKLRGEQSDGLFLPLKCLEYTGVDMDSLNIGDTITTVNGHEICRKYIPRGKHHATAAGGAGKRAKRKAKRSIAPVFYEHIDTEQLAYNLHMFKPGDLIEITRKLHGTSARTSHTKVFKGMKRTIWDKLFRREGTPIYDWGYVSGTRRTVLDTFDGGFYGSNEFRKPYHDFFEGKLLKGETVYYEIVGFTHDGGSIMGVCDNKKLKDKEFVKKYGEQTVFSYGCVPHPKTYTSYDENLTEVQEKQSDIYVYRMTMTNEDGEVVEYTPDQMRHRCMYMGVKTVPLHWYGFIPENPGSKEDDTISAGEWILNKAEQFYDGEEPIDPTHIREGVVVRVINRPTFTAYKHKNFQFKVLEGIIKETAEAPDMEEADGLDEEDTAAEAI
jgi:hypothetical protein